MKINKETLLQHLNHRHGFTIMITKNKDSTQLVISGSCGEDRQFITFDSTNDSLEALKQFVLLCEAVKQYSKKEELEAKKRELLDLMSLEEIESEAVIKLKAVKLTKRQIELLDLIANGVNDNNKIMEKLTITIYTLKAHLTEIYRRLNVNNRTDALVKYLAWREIQKG